MLTKLYARNALMNSAYDGAFIMYETSPTPRGQGAAGRRAHETQPTRTSSPGAALLRRIVAERDPERIVGRDEQGAPGNGPVTSSVISTSKERIR